MVSKTLDIITKDGLTYIQFPRLTACNAVKHIFSTRIGGGRSGGYGSMNLRFYRGGSREKVLKNYEKLLSPIPI